MATEQIIKELSHRIGTKVQTNVPGAVPQSKQGSFSSILDNKMDQAFYQKLSAEISKPAMSDQNIKTISGDQLKVPTNLSPELTKVEGPLDPKKAMVNLFSSLNRESLRLESMVEIMSQDKAKLSRQQLLAYQVASGSATMHIELASKVAQQVHNGINTIMQTNVG